MKNVLYAFRSHPRNFCEITESSSCMYDLDQCCKLHSKKSTTETFFFEKSTVSAFLSISSENFAKISRKGAFSAKFWALRALNFALLSPIWWGKPPSSWLWSGGGVESRGKIYDRNGMVYLCSRRILDLTKEKLQWLEGICPKVGIQYHKRGTKIWFQMRQIMDELKNFNEENILIIQKSAQFSKNKRKSSIC